MPVKPASMAADGCNLEGASMCSHEGLKAPHNGGMPLKVDHTVRSRSVHQQFACMH